VTNSERILASALCAIVALPWLPAAASGSQVRELTDTPNDPGGDPGLEGTLYYTARPGESNRLRVDKTSDGTALLLTDRGVDAINIATDSCETVTAQQVRCVPRDTTYYMRISLGDGPDRSLFISGGGLGTRLSGGEGADVLRSRSKSTSIYGGKGNDLIRATAVSGPGYPVDCGPGRDRATRTKGRRTYNCERIVRIDPQP